MTTQPDNKPDIICEFCRSQGAPTARELTLLSAKGRRESVRQWIIKSRSVEIQNQIDGIAEQLYEQKTNDDPLFYDALSVEELEDRIASAKRHARQRVIEQIRYGAIRIDEIESPRPWVAYNQYHELCDQEWGVMVEGKSSNPLLQKFREFLEQFFDLTWRNRLIGIAILAFLGLDGVIGIVGKPASGPFSRTLAYALILISALLTAASLIRFLGWWNESGEE